MTASLLMEIEFFQWVRRLGFVALKGSDLGNPIIPTNFSRPKNFRFSQRAKH